MTNNFSGYVLAGGKSSRMGADKAFLKIGDKTFIENATRALKPNCDQVKIVLNQSQTHFIEKLPENTNYIFDLYENRGALGGIHAALKDCETEFAVILAVDLPFVDESAIRNLCEIALNSKTSSSIVPNQNDGKLQPLCAVYRIEKCLPELEKYLVEKTSNAVKNFLNLINAKFIESNLIAGDKNILFNINQPFDYNLLNENKN